MNEEKIDISIVVPLYNEEANIDYLIERLLSVFNTLNTTYEIVCINDGSRDNTLKLLVDYHNRNPAIKVINRRHKQRRCMRG